MTDYDKLKRDQLAEAAKGILSRLPSSGPKPKEDK